MRRLLRGALLMLAATGLQPGATAEDLRAQEADAAARTRLDVRGEAELADTVLELHFLDVGQGDAVLVRAPGGETALYDGGRPETPLLRILQELEVERLDLVIASHGHADHIGGLPEVIRHYRPAFFVDNGIPHTTQAYRRLLEAVRDAGSQLVEPTARTIALGEASLHILPPPGRPGWDQNDNSVGVLVAFGDFRASLLGDSESRQQAELVRSLESLPSVSVHKASHHGSRNGDTSALLRLLAPEAVVISLGGDNGYGHPHSETLRLYRDAGAEIFRTDRDGALRIEGRRDGTFAVFQAGVMAGGAAGARSPPSRIGEPRGDRAPSGPDGEGEKAATGDDCIDINHAGPGVLEAIIHVGPVRALEIVALRPFESVDDLVRVRGIAAARLRDIRAQGRACVRRPEGLDRKAMNSPNGVSSDGSRFVVLPSKERVTRRASIARENAIHRKPIGERSWHRTRSSSSSSSTRSNPRQG